MRRSGPESEPRPSIQLEDNKIFLGSDGIAFTSFGSTLQLLLINVQTLRLLRNGNLVSAERRREIETEIKDLCTEIGIPNNKAVMKDTERQFRRIVDARTSVLNLSSYNVNGHKPSGYSLNNNEK